MAIPRKDSLLVQWSANVDAKLTASPVTYGYDAAFATAYNALHSAFEDAYSAMMQAREDGTRSESLTAIRTQAKENLLQMARAIYKAVQGSNTISDADKILLGVHIPDPEPTPQPIPGVVSLAVEKVDGNTFWLRASDPLEPTRRARPPYTSGLAFFSFVGAEPPAQANAFTYEGVTGLMRIQITIAAPLGSTVWFTCHLFNGRKETGPACTPVSAIVGAGSSMPMAA